MQMKLKIESFQVKFILTSLVVFLLSACTTKEAVYNILQHFASKKCDNLVYPPDVKECQKGKSYREYEYENEYNTSK